MNTNDEINSPQRGHINLYYISVIFGEKNYGTQTDNAVTQWVYIMGDYRVLHKMWKSVKWGNLSLRGNLRSPFCA